MREMLQVTVIVGQGRESVAMAIYGRFSGATAA